MEAKMNKKNKRINNLLSLLQESPDLSVKALSEILNVSDMTIRRDLKYLKENNLFYRNHGIALPPHSNSSVTNIEKEYTLHTERTKFLEQKQRIGQFAATLIEPNDTLILDAGTTIAEMAKYIPEDMTLNITCYNYYTLAQLFDKKLINITLAGGVLHRNDQMFESSYGNELIQSQRASKFFMAASGVHETLGLTCAHNYEVLTKRAAMKSSLTSILLVDSSKFSLIRTAYVSQLNEVDTIITDDGITKEWKEIIQNLGIALYVV